MNIWLVLISMGIITFAIRYSVIGMLGNAEMSPAIKRELRYVPPAVLTAIIVPSLLMPAGVFDLSFGNIRLIAGVIAIGVAYFTKNTLATIGAGMAVLWLLQWIVV